MDDGPVVSGSADDPTGIASADGRMRVFAGVRNDSFFFNLSGFEAVAATVRSVAGDLSFDEAGCPQLDAATAAALGDQLVHDGDGSEASDDFARQSVLALAISIDKTLLTPDGDVLAVWASTHRRP